MRHHNLTPHPHEPGNPLPSRVLGGALPPAARETIDDPVALGPLSDREVPLPDGQIQALVNAWLDDEATTEMIRASQGGNDAIDLWTRINNEAELLRTRTTPLYVHKRIMESLPADVHRLSHPWYRRSVTLNLLTLIIAAAALLGIGALIARVAAH